MKRIFSLVFILFSVISAWTQTTYTWNQLGGGSWATSTNWTPNRTTPAANDILVFSNGGTKTITSVPTQTIGALLISNNSNITLEGAAAGGGGKILSIGNVTGTDLLITNGSSLSNSNTLDGITLAASSTGDISGILNVDVNSIFNNDAAGIVTTVAGTINNFGTVTCTNATRLLFSIGGTYVHAINGGTIPTSTWNAASNCNITGITSTAPTDLGQAFGNFTWNSPGHNGTINLNSALTTINGNFTVNQAGSATPTRVTNPLVLSSNNGLTLNVAGNMTVSNTGAAVWLAITSGTATVTINVGGNFVMSNATTYFDYAIGTTMNSHVVNVTGNLDISGGLFDWAFIPTAGSNFATLNLNGNFSLTGTGAMTTSVASTTIPNGKLVFVKSGLQNITVADPSNLIYTNFEISSVSTVELLSSFNLTSQSGAFGVKGGKFVVLSGGILDANTFQIASSSGLTVGSNNAFTLNSGAGIITANPFGVHQIGFAGPTISAAIETRTFSSGANYTYDGTVTQESGTFVTTPTANQVNNLTVNNTAGNTTTGVTLQQPFAVANILTLTWGHITSTSVNLLTMNAASLVSGQNYGAFPRQPGSSFDSYVNGPMRKIGNTNFLFPLGKVSGGNHFCGISSPANITDSYTAEYIRGSATLLGPITAVGLDHVSNCNYWIITTTAASPSVNVTLSWNGVSNCNNAVYVNDLATLVAAHFGTSWDSYGGTADPISTVGSGSLTWNGVTTFSSFALGSTSPFTNPLPVKLVNVRAYRNGDRNKIEWTNLTEANVLAYEVERSVNGILFQTMVSVAARSNANDREDYFEYDGQINPVTYYRIKVISLDNKISYSPVVKVTGSDQFYQDLVVYPNPVTGRQFTLQMNSSAGNYYLRIYAANGQAVKTELLNHPGGSFSKTIELPGQLPAGQYYLQVTGGERAVTRKFIIQ